jgi:hypothetical protein
VGALPSHLIFSPLLIFTERLVRYPMVDVSDFTLDDLPSVGPEKSQRGLPRHKPGERFLKGPIPWSWLGRAGQLPGSALHVAIVIWHLAGLHGARTVALSNVPLDDLGVDRHAKRRGLAALEGAGLVVVERHAGRNPLVTLLDTPGAIGDAGDAAP